MSSITNQSQSQLFTVLERPPAVQWMIPGLPRNTVRLYRDEGLNSPYLDIAVENWRQKERHNIPNDMADKATILLYNLEPGVVVTMLDHPGQVPQGKPFCDLSWCGSTIDLIGTGRTEAVDLKKYSMNDNILQLFWRYVNLTYGAIELFNDFNFTGARVVIFFAEWEPDKRWSINDWWIRDKVTSARWWSLQDRIDVNLYDHESGNEGYHNVSGFRGDKQIGDFRQVNFNDRLSSFTWKSIVPMKSVVKPIEIHGRELKNVTGFDVTQDYNNNSDLPISAEVSIDTENKTSISVSTTETNVSNFGLKYAAKASAEVPGVGGVELSWELSFNYEYTKSVTNGTSKEETLRFSQKRGFQGPPRTKGSGKLTVSVGQLDRGMFETTAERWYEREVAGSTQDWSNNGWWKRVEPVQMEIKGTVVSSSLLSVESQDLPGWHRGEPIDKKKDKDNGKGKPKKPSPP